MAVRGVVFDIGGVLEVTPQTGWQVRWCQHLGIDPADALAKLGDTWAGGTLGTVTLEEVEQQTAKHLGLDDAALSAFMADMWAEYVGRLNQQMAAFFAGLRPRYRTGILSNSFVGAREREQAAYGFEGMCDVVVYSHEEGIEKPDPRFYTLVCDRLGVTPEETVFLDDKEENVDGARRVGMDAVLFVDNDRAIRDVRAVLASAHDSPQGMQLR